MEPPPSSSQPPPPPKPKPKPGGGGSSGKKRQRQRRDRGQGARSQPFHDLCVELRRDSSTTVDQVRGLSRRLAELGYGVVAWNETVVGQEGVRQLERAQQKKGGAGGRGGGGAGIEALRLATQGAGTPARQLRRVTVVVDDPGEAQFLTGALRGLRSAGAELVAARPTSDRVLTFLCEAGDVDLISLDVRGGRAGVSLSAKQAEKAIARGLLFEIQYAGAIEECAAAAAAAAAATATQQQPQQQQQQMRRQQVLANIGAIVAATRGRGLVWSSGAERAEWLRGPHDVMNLAVVLGLKEHQALAALTSACNAAIGHAEARCLEWLPVQVLAQPMSSSSRRQEEPATGPTSIIDSVGAAGEGRGRTTGGGKTNKGRKRKGGSGAAGPTPMEA